MSMDATDELLSSLLGGKPPREALDELLAEGGDAFGRGRAAAEEGRDDRVVPHPSLYGFRVQRVAANLERKSREHGLAFEEARAWLAELRRVPMEDRRGEVERFRTRFRGEVFAELLVEEAQSHLPEDPWAAHGWADLASDIRRRSLGFDEENGVGVRIFAHRGNAHRAMGRLTDAAADLHFARRLLETSAVTDLSVYAELDRLEGSLRKDQRDLVAAENLLHRAICLYRILGESELRARTEITLGANYYNLSRTDEAVRTAESALADLSFGVTPYLYLAGRYNLALALVDLGEHRRALTLLEEDRPLQEGHFERLTKLRVTWLRGRISHALGRPERAVEHLTAAREGFIEAGIGYDVAMVSLDLVLALRDLGRLNRVRQIAAEALHLFRSQHIPRETLASLRILCNTRVH